MYVENEFILALLKDEDWLQNPAEKVYKKHKEDLWTSKYTLVELLLLSYREDWNPLKIISGACELVQIRDDPEDVKAAASHMEESNYTPFDSLHLVASNNDKIISSDQTYDKNSERLKLEDLKEE